MAEGPANLPLQVSDASLSCISLDDQPSRVRVDFDLFCRQSIGLALAANQIASRDLQLLLFGVARQADDLHPVQQRTWDGVEHIGGGQEHDPREIERNSQIVVAERRILFRVEYFQHRGRRIALDSATHLVDFVEHHDAVARARFLDRLNDVAGKRADIGAPVAPDVRFIVNAAETDSHERPLHRSRDRLPERSLADAGRADEAENRGLALRCQFSNCEIFDDAALDLFQTVMVLIEDASRLADIDRLFFRQTPWQFDQPVEVAANHACFRGAIGHALVAANLPARLAFRLRRHFCLCDRLVQFRDLLCLSVAFTELALNGRHLLAEDRFALTLVESSLGLLSDLPAQAKHLDTPGQMP
jgi:hypothetical protein